MPPHLPQSVPVTLGSGPPVLTLPCVSQRRKVLQAPSAPPSLTQAEGEGAPDVAPGSLPEQQQQQQVATQAPQDYGRPVVGANSVLNLWPTAGVLWGGR